MCPGGQRNVRNANQCEAASIEFDLVCVCVFNAHTKRLHFCCVASADRALFHLLSHIALYIGWSHNARINKNDRTNEWARANSTNTADSGSVEWEGARRDGFPRQMRCCDCCGQGLCNGLDSVRMCGRISREAKSGSCRFGCKMRIK